jgi:serine/threonine protein kinase
MKKHLGHYEIVAEIGRGGMGVVYKGYEPSLARFVAIKELSPMLAHDPVVVERFLREARSMALLNDPHIIQIYAIGQEDDEPFFVMEFVDGVSVAALVKRDGRLEVDDALKIVLETARGLSTAHDRGVIHRDIKPANLMINQRGQVKIADFGIALANHDMSAKLTFAGDVVGTAAYLSPEVMQGNPVDPRSEVYSVGVVLFEMLSGRTPFSDSNVYKLMHDVVETPAPDVREFVPEIDADIVAIVARMLAKDPAERYQSMHELIADLKKHPLITHGGPIKVSIPAPSEMPPPVALSMPMTPGVARRMTPPPPDMGRRQSAITPLITSVLTPAAAVPAVSSDRQQAFTPPPAGPTEPVAPGASAAPVVASKSRWPLLVMALLMFLAGATWALRGELMGLFGAARTESPVTTTSTPAGSKSVSSPGTSSATAGSKPAKLSDAEIAAARKARVTAYLDATIVAVLGLLITGFWFGVHRRKKGESEAGIHSLANMKWRDCIGLVLEVLGRDGYKEPPGSKPLGDGGTEFLLLRGSERVLLGFKLGTAYRLSESNVRDFASGLEMQGATTGILLTLGSAEGSARVVAKSLGIQLLDGATIWPKVRQYVSPNILDHVRLQVAAQTRKGLWIGSVVSILLGLTTFLVVGRSSPADMDSATAATAPAPTQPAAPAPAQMSAATIKQNRAAAQAIADVAKLTDEQRTERRAKASKEVNAIAQVSHAVWPTQSTLQVDLKDSDGKDTNLITEVCSILTQYEELRLTRLQIDPPPGSTASVRWGQCQ